MGCFATKSLKILVLLGSAKKQSVNTGLAHELLKSPINLKHSVQLEFMRLDRIPIYNEDKQNKGDLCEEVVNLRDHASSAKAIIFVTPEINGSISPLILNALVWLSRTYDTKKPPLLSSKKAGVLSASYLSQNQIVDCIQIGKSLNINFFSENFHLSLGDKGINEQGKVVSSAQIERLQTWYKAFVDFILKK